MTHQHYYRTLGVPVNASHKVITKAFRRLAHKYHPDRTRDNKEWAEQKFKQISEAYEVLRDPKRRLEYDLKFGFRYPDIFAQERWWEDESFDVKPNPDARRVRSPVSFIDNWKAETDNRRQPHLVTVSREDRLPEPFWGDLWNRIRSFFNGHGPRASAKPPYSSKVRVYRSRYIRMDVREKRPRKIRIGRK